MDHDLSLKNTILTQLQCTLLKLILGTTHGDLRLDWSCSAKKTQSMKLLTTSYAQQFLLPKTEVVFTMKEDPPTTFKL